MIYASFLLEYHLTITSFLWQETIANNDKAIECIVCSLARKVEESKLALKLLLELSRSNAVRNSIGNVQGCILLLVTMSSSDDTQAAKDAQELLDNLSCLDHNVIQMANANFFGPLLRLLSSGTSFLYCNNGILGCVWFIKTQCSGNCFQCKEFSLQMKCLSGCLIGIKDDEKLKINCTTCWSAVWYFAPLCGKQYYDNHSLLVTMLTKYTILLFFSCKPIPLIKHSKMFINLFTAYDKIPYVVG